MFDWQDLQYFLVLAHTGTLSGAASELSVEHATVGRRVMSLESALGLKLIYRLPRSIRLTEDGKAIAMLARSMAQGAQAVETYALRASSALSGTVRISVPPTIGSYCIAPHIRVLRESHPALKIVMEGSPDIAPLDRGVADIAVRMVKPEDGSLVTRRIGTVRFGLYANHTYAARPSAQWEFIAYDSSLDHVKHQKWLRKNIDGRPIVFEASDAIGQQMAVRNGVGVAVLPTLIGDNDAELVRLDIGSEPPETGLWLVTYPDLRRTPAIKAVMEFLVHCIGRETRYTDKDVRG
ncbi:LysR family transcriptional regulator [Paraburkholderia phenazinium]|jgi:DNA-binding transcriptional LysR family regulator|uniref:DNA-binding transcriptional regulator, LysR family n=1 Tax=Paraburkholderia phenazinium TaxID=60549 RepID=A0A1N6LHA4_9BURK|nr:LysR family transcriptional regulator [Paraburkholderia phenazinium]SIO68056.1 DNA-binding transcriptional regulator, LysR family [Paraburkholderia phenazinium]